MYTFVLPNNLLTKQPFRFEKNKIYICFVFVLPNNLLTKQPFRFEKNKIYIYYVFVLPNNLLTKNVRSYLLFLSYFSSWGLYKK
jgi:hypothetical protein